MKARRKGRVVVKLTAKRRRPRLIVHIKLIFQQAHLGPVGEPLCGDPEAKYSVNFLEASNCPECRAEWERIWRVWRKNR